MLDPFAMFALGKIAPPIVIHRDEHFRDTHRALGAHEQADTNRDEDDPKDCHL